MVDGKVCNALSESHSTKCYICEAKPTEMNNLNECLDKKVSTKYFEFFEYFLHLSYKSVMKMWQAKGPQQKQKVLERKREVRWNFRDKMDLLGDQPRDGGKGTSNNGNVPRNFFSNPRLSAEITVLNENLIHRCSTLLQSASGHKINVHKFNEYALDTAKGYYLPGTICLRRFTRCLFTDLLL